MKTKIQDFLKEHRNDIVKDVFDLVAIPSVKGVPEEGAPFGRACLDALLHIEKKYTSDGYNTKIEEGKHYVTAVSEGDDKLIGIFSHADVVPVTEGDWVYTKPFEPIEKDGFIIGRGSEDNSSGVVGAIWAMRALKNAGYTPKSRILLFSGSDEESGMTDVSLYAKTEEMPDFSIVPDNSYPVCRGEKTIINFWADFHTSFEDILEVKGGQAFNIALDKAEVTLRDKSGLFKEIESKIKDRADCSVSKAEDKITLITKGRSTHAAIPEKSLNAFLVAIDVLSELSISENDKKILIQARPLLSNPFLKDAGLFTTDSEFGDTTCVNGIVKTDNGKLSLSFDCRYGNEVDGDKLKEDIENYLNKIGAEYNRKYGLDGYVIPEASPLVKAMADAYREITGDNDSKPYLSLGGTYARFLKNAVSTGSCLSVTPSLDLPEGHGGVHQPDEMLDIEGFLQGIEILSHMIIKADKVLHNETSEV